MNRIATRLVRYRRPLDRLLLAAAITLPSLCVLGIPYFLRGWHSWAAVRFFVLYVAPLFLAAPLWARLRLARAESTPTAVHVIDVTVLVVSFARFMADEWIPFSGHMLFLTYTLLATPERWYRWLAVMLLVETTIFKLWVWRDAESWGLGLVLGVLSGILSRSLQRVTAPTHTGQPPSHTQDRGAPA